MKKIKFDLVILLAIIAGFSFSKYSDKPLCTTPPNNSTQGAITICPGTYSNITFNGVLTMNGSSSYYMDLSKFNSSIVMSSAYFYPDCWNDFSRTIGGSVIITNGDFAPECYGNKRMKINGNLTLNGNANAFIDASRLEIGGNLTMTGTSTIQSDLQVDTLLVNGTITQNQYGRIYANYIQAKGNLNTSGYIQADSSITVYSPATWTMNNCAVKTKNFTITSPANSLSGSGYLELSGLRSNVGNLGSSSSTKLYNPLGAVGGSGGTGSVTVLGSPYAYSCPF